jgi:hypothetical protein
MECLKKNKEFYATGDKILSAVATLIQISPVVNHLMFVRLGTTADVPPGHSGE